MNRSQNVVYFSSEHIAGEYVPDASWPSAPRLVGCCVTCSVSKCATSTGPCRDVARRAGQRGPRPRSWRARDASLAQQWKASGSGTSSTAARWPRVQKSVDPRYASMPELRRRAQLSCRRCANRCLSRRDKASANDVDANHAATGRCSGDGDGRRRGPRSRGLGRARASSRVSSIPTSRRSLRQTHG